MQIRVKRVIEAVLDDEEFETVMTGLSELSSNTDFPQDVSKKAGQMYEAFANSLHAPPGQILD